MRIAQLVLKRLICHLQRCQLLLKQLVQISKMRKLQEARRQWAENANGKSFEGFDDKSPKYDDASPFSPSRGFGSRQLGPTPEVSSGP